MPGHKSFCISEPSLIKLLHFEGLGFASVSDKNPKFLMRTVISWSRGQGVGQWGMDEANLEEPFWSLWSNNDDIDAYDKNYDENWNQDDHEDDANQFWTFI